jgi:hypothetical protein
MPHDDPGFVAGSRRRDLLLTLVMVGIGLTPAWFTPIWFAAPWLITGLFLGIPAVYYSYRYAPWAPTPADDLPRILQALHLQSAQSFCDLGAGDGRLLIRVHAATGAKCTGIEVAPLQYLAARLRLALQGGPGTAMVYGDLHPTDLSGFDDLYVWGTAYWVGTPAFSEQMQHALKPGARLVSYHHPLCGLEPERVDEGGIRPIHVYIIR